MHQVSNKVIVINGENVGGCFELGPQCFTGKICEREERQII